MRYEDAVSEPSSVLHEVFVVFMGLDLHTWECYNLFT